MYRELLPIGSVGLLKGGTKRRMIVGRIVAREGEEQISTMLIVRLQKSIVLIQRREDYGNNAASFLQFNEK